MKLAKGFMSLLMFTVHCMFRKNSSAESIEKDSFKKPLWENEDADGL